MKTMTNQDIFKEIIYGYVSSLSTEEIVKDFIESSNVEFCNICLLVLDSRDYDTSSLKIFK